MTVYNAGRHLIPAVESILSQSFRDFEFVVVDDASSDGSVEILRQFATRDPRIRLIANTANSGQTACLNQGLREAKGEWIARQDADDLSLPARLEAAWKAVETNDHLVLLGSNGWIISEDGHRTGMIHVPLHDEGIRWGMPFRNPFIHAGVLFRRILPDGTLVQYNERLKICQDWELWSRICRTGQTTNLPARLVAYRHRENSLSHQSSDRTRAENRSIAAELFRQSFPGFPLSDDAAGLLESFREGLSPENRNQFWALYRTVRKHWLECGHPRARQAEAVHHLQAGGALAARAPLLAAKDLAHAWTLTPVWVLGMLAQRLIARPHETTAF